MTLFLAMPGIPPKEHRVSYPDMKTCTAQIGVIKAEVYMYAALEYIPRERVRFNAECVKSYLVSADP